MSAPVVAGLLLLAVLWGSAFPMIKVGLEGLGVAHLTLARHLVASLAFVPFLALSGHRLLPERRDLPRFFLLGVLGITIYHLALNAGEVRVSAGASSLIIATAPVITAVLAYLLLGERMPLLGWSGSLLSFAGVAMIVLGDSGDLRLDPYALFVLLAALVTSLFFVLQKPLFGRYRAVEVIAFSTWTGTVPLLLFLPGLFGAVAAAPTDALLATVYIGVFPSAVGYALFAVALARAPVTVVSSFLYTVPVFGLLLSWLFLGEVPSLLTVLGGIVAIGGIIIVNAAKRRVARLATVA